jgi:hypothetical protein
MARASRTEWAKRVAEWNESGLSGAEFAAKAGLKEATLRHWKWQLGRERRQRRPRARVAAAAFVEVKPALTAQLVAVDVFELVTRDGLSVCVPPSFDETALRRLLAIIAER